MNNEYINKKMNKKQILDWGKLMQRVCLGDSDSDSESEQEDDDSDSDEGSDDSGNGE